MNSFYVLPSNPMSASGWEDLFKWKASGKDTFVEVDVLGPKSKVAAVATPDTAYAFRPALLAVQFGTAWRNEKKNDRMNLALSSAGTVGIELDRRALIASSRHRAPWLSHSRFARSPGAHGGVPRVAGTFRVPDVAVADTNGDGVVDASDAGGGGAVVAPGTVTAGGLMAMAGKVVVGVLVIGFAL